MEKKWYEYFVSVESGSSAPAPPQATSTPARPQAARPQPSAAQAIADIAAQVKVEQQQLASKPIPKSATFQEIYQAAEIPAPASGFTIFKIADLLQSEHIRALPVEIKRSSVLLAVEAAGVKIQDIIQDAVRRDKALDTFELVQQKGVESLEARMAEENKKLQAEADRVLTELRAKIQSNNDAVAKERERFQAWRLEKQKEEQRIYDAVAPFVSPNPISTGPAAAPAPPPAPEK
jgi:hypothetical protein